MITRPFDLAMIFGVFALVVITVGFGLSSINTTESQNYDTEFFRNVETNVNSSTGLKGTADLASQAISGQEDASITASEDNILVAGFQSMLQLGRTWSSTRDSMRQASDELGIDPIYWLTAASLLIIMFFVILYTWLRGT